MQGRRAEIVSGPDTTVSSTNSELEKLEFKHKNSLKEHAEALKNANKTICELCEQLATALASNTSQAPSSSHGE
jgi:hypothetical protein